MQKSALFELMDELYAIVNTTSVEDAPEKLIRHASAAGNAIGMEALARTLVIENARRRHADAKYIRTRDELAARSEERARTKPIF